MSKTEENEEEEKQVTENKSVSVGRHSCFDPGDIIANLSVNPRIASLRASNTPGNNALELPIADDRTAGIPLCT